MSSSTWTGAAIPNPERAMTAGIPIMTFGSIQQGLAIKANHTSKWRNSVSFAIWQVMQVDVYMCSLICLWVSQLGRRGSTTCMLIATRLKLPAAISQVIGDYTKVFSLGVISAKAILDDPHSLPMEHWKSFCFANPEPISHKQTQTSWMI